MRLSRFLFGAGRRREYIPTMNLPTRPPQGTGNGGSSPESGAGGCNPPRRGCGEGCEGYSPYGVLLPDAEKYMKEIADRGNEPYLFSMRERAQSSDAYLEAIWTGEHMQLTSMRISSGESSGKERHEDTDQMRTVTAGRCRIMIGRSEDRLSPLGELRPGDCAIIPAGYWHELISYGLSPLRLISVYAPPHHPYGTRKENGDLR